jgi:hypothetical protein
MPDYLACMKMSACWCTITLCYSQLYKLCWNVLFIHHLQNVQREKLRISWCTESDNKNRVAHDKSYCSAYYITTSHIMAENKRQFYKVCLPPTHILPHLVTRSKNDDVLMDCDATQTHRYTSTFQENILSPPSCHCHEKLKPHINLTILTVVFWLVTTICNVASPQRLSI